MIVELGHYALVLALAVALIGTVVPLWGVKTNDGALMRIGVSSSLLLLVLVAIAYGALTKAYLDSDFSVLNVVENSHSAKPLMYKISGVWSNHEGSMMLWVLILALFSGLLAWFGRGMPQRLFASVLAVQSSIGAAFLLFLLVASNPFARLAPAPMEGRGLNPLLQDPGLAIHPPLLYIGYVGCSVAFSFAIGALITGRIDAAWARFVRPWTLIAWCFLTLGIAMGSYWAYYELGWGGWWFWDPVENASLMPWLVATALIHSTVVMEKRDALKVWTVLLSILTFSLSLIGTFLVRSGVLTSVHAFAVDPERGLFILGILIVFIGGSLTLFAWRASLLRQGGLFAPVSREGALVLNNLFLAAAAAAVFIGTLYPLALEALTGAKISVGAPFFDATFLPLMLPLAFILPYGQALAWKRGDLLGVAQRLMVALGLSIAITVLVYAATWGGPVLAPLGIGLGFWLILGSAADIWMRAKGRGVSLAIAFKRAVGLPLSIWGSTLAHMGIGVSMIGIACTAWGVEKIVEMKPGEQVQVGRFDVRLEGAGLRNGPDYRENFARFSVIDGGQIVGALEPGKRIFTGRTMPTSEAALLTRGLGQVYASVGDVNPQGQIAARLYWKPWVLLIWIGSVIMALGGFLSVLDRRARIAAAVKARLPRAVPAE